MEIKINKVKICRKCNLEIDEKKERYTHVEDWDKQNKVNESWWHFNCFKESINRDLTQLEKTAAIMLKKAGTIFQNLPDEFKQERVEIC